MAQNWEERARLCQNNYQNLYWRWKEFPRTALGLLKTNIGLLLFGQAGGNDDYTTPMMLYHQRYTEDQKQRIALIYNRIVALVPVNIDVHFNFTYLFIKADREFEYIIFCCRSSTSLYFIEPNGQVYRSWQDFLKTNKLLHCEYIAPRTGFYQMNGEFQNYQSPAAPQGIIRNYPDWIATGAAIGCLAGEMLSLSPVVLAATSAGLGYGFLQSLGLLYDRYSPSELVYIFNYMNLNSARLTRLRHSADYLITQYGNSTVNTIRILNYTALACHGELLLFNLYEAWNKINNGEFSYSDAFHLTFQTFLTYGAVTNVRELHQFLTENCSTSSINVTNKKLTKTQRRNLQKRRANTRNRGQQNFSETVRVQEMDARSTLKLMVKNGIALPRSMLKDMYPRAEIIIDGFFEIRNLSYSFFIQNTINAKQFWDGLLYNFQNLYKILEEDLKQIKSFLRNYFPDVPSASNVDQVLNSTFDQVTQSAQDISDMFNETIEIAEIRNQSENSENRIEQTINLETRTLYQKILDSAKHIAYTCQIPETTIAAVLIFSDAVMFVTNELLKCNSEYDALYTKNAELLGEEKARKMFEALGTKTTDDFILNDEVLSKDISKILNRIEDFHRNNCNIIGKTDTISPLLQKVVTEFQNFVVTEFQNFLVEISFIDVPGVLGINQTAKIIQKISLCLVQKLITSAEKVANDAKILYEVNVKIIGEKLTRDMLRSFGLYTDECQMFSHIMEELKELGIPPLDCLHTPSFLKVQLKRSIETRENNPTYCRSSNNLYIFMSVCDKLCRKINVDTNYSKPEKARIYERVIYFVGHKFLSEMKKSKSRYELLKFNIEVVGPNLFKTMLMKIGLLDEEHLMLLKEIAEKLNDYEHLKAEYFEYYEINNPDLKHIKLWENTISDEGYTAYIVECYARKIHHYYRNFASYLFNINIDDNAHFERNEQFVILRLQNKVVIFDFNVQVNDRALIILMNLCQITEQEDDQRDRIES